MDRRAAMVLNNDRANPVVAEKGSRRHAHKASPDHEDRSFDDGQGATLPITSDYER